jgi:endogenous inhibitor of DNA gyrase (YacG/DUF329 family)
MISRFQKISIIGDEEWNNTPLITFIINNISPKAVILLKEKGQCAEQVRNITFIKGLRTIGYLSNWLESNTSNYMCHKNILKDEPDLIILFIKNSNSKNNYENIMKQSLIHKIPLLSINENSQPHYMTQFQFQCGECGTSSLRKITHPFGKYCSQKCILKDHLELHKIIEEDRLKGKNISEENSEKKKMVRENSFQYIQECNIDNFTKKCQNTFGTSGEVEKCFIEDTTPPKPELGKNVSEIKLDKFSRMMMLEANRHAYLQKKENYKKQMRKPSSSSSSSRQGKVKSLKKYKLKVQKSNRICKALTKKDNSPCSNSALKGSDYCGITSHKKLGKKVISSKSLESLESLNSSPLQ